MVFLYTTVMNNILRSWFIKCCMSFICSQRCQGVVKSVSVCHSSFSILTFSNIVNHMDMVRASFSLWVCNVGCLVVRVKSILCRIENQKAVMTFSFHWNAVKCFRVIKALIISLRILEWTLIHVFCSSTLF